MRTKRLSDIYLRTNARFIHHVESKIAEIHAYILTYLIAEILRYNRFIETRSGRASNSISPSVLNAQIASAHEIFFAHTPRNMASVSPNDESAPRETSFFFRFEKQVENLIVLLPRNRRAALFRSKIASSENSENHDLFRFR